MKKTFILGAFATLMMVSCSKDYNCQCIQVESITGSSDTTTVIVNGKITVKEDKLLPVFAGQPIRFEPESKPRFEPISEEAWNATYSTGMPSHFSGGVPMPDLDHPESDKH